MKSNRRSVLIGLGALTVGGGAVFGTGAFSSVDAERDVSVQVANDADAFLSIDIHTDSNGSEFVEMNAEGDQEIVEFDFSGEEDDVDGLNDEAITNFHNLITITNNGSNEVDLNIEARDGDDNEVTDGFAAYEGSSPETSIENETLDPDNSAEVDVGFQFDTTEADADDVENIETILISAE